jgi:hypothetical protein
MFLLMKTVGNRQLRTLNFPFKAKKRKKNKINKSNSYEALLQGRAS